MYSLSVDIRQRIVRLQFTTNKKLDTKEDSKGDTHGELCQTEIVNISWVNWEARDSGWKHEGLRWQSCGRYREGEQ